MTKIIGIAGTAKNTGKTTTMTAVMKRVYQEQLRLGITSIGYDGEVLDNVTGLPKPRIHGEKDTLVAVAEGCLKASSARVEIIRDTGIRTALGKIIIGMVREPGPVVIAGPNKSSEVRAVNNYLREHGCDLILVDGALNRLAPMVETDGLIIATGAARTSNLQKLAAETHSLSVILNLPQWTGGDSSMVTVASLLSESMVEELLGEIKPETEVVRITGVVGENSMQSLLDWGKEILAGKTIIMADPIKILVAAPPDKTLRCLVELDKQGTPVLVERRVRLLAVTINPFYPKYRVASQDYEPAYLDKDEMKRIVGDRCPVPVVNVMEEGIDRLWKEVNSL